MHVSLCGLLLLAAEVTPHAVAVQGLVTSVHSASLISMS